MRFIDEAKIHVSSGSGGAGAVSFRREKFVPRGGPDGGDGGRGGDVVFVSDEGLATLMDFKYKRNYTAEDGQAGQGKLKTGSNASTLKIKVPVGTVIRDKKTGELLFDLTVHDQQFTLLNGGRGGKGNNFFKGPSNQTPLKAQPGISGQKRELLLELKLLADVGLIGFPNAGKSTLLSCISNSKPKVADYPFTTLVPNLGVVRVEEEKSFVVADMPGLIEGAHQGTGLGIKFLKHIERTKLFLHLIDISEENPYERYQKINEELKRFNPKLLKRPQLVIFTKTDLLGDQEVDASKLSPFKKEGIETFEISAVQHKGTKELIYKVSQMLSWK